MSATPDFSDAYDRVAERYTGHLGADLSDAGIPPELANDVARVVCGWAASGDPPPLMAAALAFHVGVMTGVEWERTRRPRPVR